MVLHYNNWADFANYFSVLFCACTLMSMAYFALGSNPDSASQGKVVIYARYSSDKQRDVSIDDQIRTIRIHLDKLGIQHDDAKIFYDEEISGEREDREEYQKVLALIRTQQVSIVACDELNRLVRSAFAGVIAEDMELYGSRLIAADGYDSLHDPGGFIATIQGKIAGNANRELGRRVRRGIAGRVLDGNGADGTHPFGYSTRYCNPEEARNYQGVGPKPKKEVFINEAEKAVVLDIYAMYTNGMSRSDISRYLNERNVPLGAQSNRRDKDGITYQRGWHKALIGKILNQRKYIGKWVWGEFKHRKTRTGKRIVRPADPRDVVKSERPDLAIVPLELWDKAQERLKQNRKKYGFKKGQKKRGHKAHYSEDYPSDLLGGLLYCAECGSRLHLSGASTGSGPYYGCPIAFSHGKNKGIFSCTQRGFVHKGRATDALCSYLREHMLGCEQWIDAVYDEATDEFKRQTANAPSELKSLEDRHKELVAAIANITKAIETVANCAPDSLVKRLIELDGEKTGIEAKMRQSEAVAKKATSLPTRDWIQSQLADLAETFMDDLPAAAKLFREFFGKINVRIIVAPGKKRGHPVLEFIPDRRRLITSVTDIARPQPRDSESENPGEVVTITLAGSDKLDRLMPTIDAMRRDGITWKAIAAKLKIAKSWANRYYNTWKALTEMPTETSDDEPTPEISDSV